MKMQQTFKSIAISSRIRLARNCSGFNFFTKLRDKSDADFIIDKVTAALLKFENFDLIKLSSLSLNECNAMLERHIISKELIENKDISAVAISDDERFFVMINEEDHIREQVILPGFDLYGAFKQIKKLDDVILSEVDVAFSRDYGFITSSPSNLGTGMRASVMMFLPALERSAGIDFLLQEARDKGFVLRGLYGEGTQSFGSFYQISNQNSLSLDENEIIDQVEEFVYQICKLELDAREEILQSNHDALIDEIYRAVGVLREAYLLEEEEMIKLLSLVKFGDALGLLKITDHKIFDKLTLQASGANLREMQNFRGFFNEEKERAKYISKKLENIIEIGAK